MKSKACIEEGSVILSTLEKKSVPPRKKLLKAASCDSFDVEKTSHRTFSSENNCRETNTPSLENSCSFSDASPIDSSVVSGKVKLYESLVDEYRKAVRSLELKRKKLAPPPRRKRSKAIEHSDVTGAERDADTKKISRIMENYAEMSLFESSATGARCGLRGTKGNGVEANSHEGAGECLETNTPGQSRSSEEKSKSVKDNELTESTAFRYEPFYRKENGMSSDEGKKMITASSLGSIDTDIKETPRGIMKPPRRKSKSAQSLLTSTPTREEDILHNLELGVSPISTEVGNDTKEISVSQEGTPFSRHRAIRRPSGFSQQLQSRRCSFQDPVASYFKSENDVRSNSPVRASVSLAYVQDTEEANVKSVEKANSISALTENEYLHVASRNAQKRQETKKKKKLLKKRIQKAFKNTTDCWPRSQKRKQLKRNNSSFIRRKSAFENNESFASLFLYNDIKGSCTLPDDLKLEPVCNDIFTTDAKENVEFPPQISEGDFASHHARRTLRERLLHPKMLGTFNSCSSLDSVALRKAQKFLLSSIHSSSSKSKSRKNSAFEIGNSPETATEAGADSHSASRDTLCSIEEDVSSSPNDPFERKTSVHCVPSDISESSKFSLKTRFFLRASSIPDFAPRIRRAFSKPTLAPTSEHEYGPENETESSCAPKSSSKPEISIHTADSGVVAEPTGDDEKKGESSAVTQPQTDHGEGEGIQYEPEQGKMPLPIPTIVVQSVNVNNCVEKLGIDADKKSATNPENTCGDSKKPFISRGGLENKSLSSNNDEINYDDASKHVCDVQSNLVKSNPLAENNQTSTADAKRPFDRKSECIDGYSGTVVTSHKRPDGVLDSTEIKRDGHENLPSNNQEGLRTSSPLNVAENEADAVVDKISEDDSTLVPSDSLAMEKNVKQFAVKISPLSEDSAGDLTIDTDMDERVTKTQRCVDTGRVVISYNAPVDGEHVTVNLLQINPDEINAEIPSKNEETNALHDNSNANFTSGPNATGGLNEILNDLHTPPCSDCESPICNVPIITVTSSTELGNSTIPEQLHREITKEWVQNQDRRECFRNRGPSNLLRASGRRRIRANSIPECEELEDYDFENIACDDDDVSSGPSPFVARKYEDNILEVTKNDDFFDFFRDRAHDEHYAHILDSDSDNEQECAKAAVEYLLNARRSSVETLLTQLSDETPCNRSKRSSLVGSFSTSNVNSRRESLKEEPEEKIEDDIFDYFGDTNNTDEKKTEGAKGDSKTENVETNERNAVIDGNVSALSSHSESTGTLAVKPDLNSEDSKILNDVKLDEESMIFPITENHDEEIRSFTSLERTSNENKEDPEFVAPEKPPRTLGVYTLAPNQGSTSGAKDELIPTTSKPDQRSTINAPNKYESEAREANVIDEPDLPETENNGGTNGDVDGETALTNVEADTGGMKLTLKESASLLANENTVKQQEISPPETESKSNIMADPHFRSERRKSFLDVDETDDIFETFENSNEFEQKNGTRANKLEVDASLKLPEANNIVSTERSDNISNIGTASTVELNDCDGNLCTKLSASKENEVDEASVSSSDVRAKEKEIPVLSSKAEPKVSTDVIKTSEVKSRDISGDNETSASDDHLLLERLPGVKDGSPIINGDDPTLKTTNNTQDSNEDNDSDDNSSAFDKKCTLLEENTGDERREESRSAALITASTNKNVERRDGSSDKMQPESEIGGETLVTIANSLEIDQSEIIPEFPVPNSKPDNEQECNSSLGSQCAIAEPETDNLRKSPSGNVFPPPNASKISDMVRTRYKSFLDIDETDDIFECFDISDAREHSSALSEVDLDDAAFDKTSQEYIDSTEDIASNCSNLNRKDTPELPLAEKVSTNTYEGERASATESKRPEVHSKAPEIYEKLEGVNDAGKAVDPENEHGFCIKSPVVNLEATNLGESDIERKSVDEIENADFCEKSKRNNIPPRRKKIANISSNQTNNDTTAEIKIIHIDPQNHVNKEEEGASTFDTLMNGRNKVISSEESSPKNLPTSAPCGSEPDASLKIEKLEDSPQSAPVLGNVETVASDKRSQTAYGELPGADIVSTENVELKTTVEKGIKPQNLIQNENTANKDSIGKLSNTNAEKLSPGNESETSKHEFLISSQHSTPENEKELALIAGESKNLNIRRKSFLDIDETDDIFECFENDESVQSDPVGKTATEENAIRTTLENNPASSEKFSNKDEKGTPVEVTAMENTAVKDATVKSALGNVTVVESNGIKRSPSSQRFSLHVDASDDSIDLTDPNESIANEDVSLKNANGGSTNVYDQYAVKSASSITSNVLENFREKIIEYGLSHAEPTNGITDSLEKNVETSDRCSTDLSLGKYSSSNYSSASYSRSSVDKSCIDTEETVTLMDLPQLQVNGSPQQVDDNDDFFDYFDDFTPEENCSARDVCVDNCQPPCSSCTKPALNKNISSPNSSSAPTSDLSMFPAGRSPLLESEPVASSNFNNSLSSRDASKDTTLGSSEAGLVQKGCNVGQSKSETSFLSRRDETESSPATEVSKVDKINENSRLDCEAAKTSTAIMSTPASASALTEAPETPDVKISFCGESPMAADKTRNLTVSSPQKGLVESNENHVSIGESQKANPHRAKDDLFSRNNLASDALFVNKDESDSFSLLDGNEIPPKKTSPTEEQSKLLDSHEQNTSTKEIMVKAFSSEDPFDYFHDQSEENFMNGDWKGGNEIVAMESEHQGVDESDEAKRNPNFDYKGMSKMDNVAVDEKSLKSYDETNQSPEVFQIFEPFHTDDKPAAENEIELGQMEKEPHDIDPRLSSIEKKLNQSKTTMKGPRNELNEICEHQKIDEKISGENQTVTGQFSDESEKIRNGCQKEIRGNKTEHDEISVVESKKIDQDVSPPSKKSRRSGAPFLLLRRESDHKLLPQSSPCCLICADEVSATLQNSSNRGTLDANPSEKNEVGFEKSDIEPDNIERRQSECLLPLKPAGVTSWERPELTECVATKCPIPSMPFEATSWERPELTECIGTRSFVIHPTTGTKRRFTVNKVAFYSNVMTSTKPPRKYSSNHGESGRKISTGAIPRILGLLKKRNSVSSMLAPSQKKLRPTRSVIYSPAKPDEANRMRRSKSVVASFLGDKHTTFLEDSKAQWKNIAQKLEDSNRSITKSVEKLYVNVTNFFSDAAAAPTKSQSTDNIKKAVECSLGSSEYTTGKQDSAGNEAKSMLKPAMSASHEMLLDPDEEFDKCFEKPDPNLPPYCHARKSLFPNVSTSDLSNLERYDENFTPRSLALGKPTIVLQTWRERQSIPEPAVRPAHSTSDLTALFRNKIESSSVASATVGRSASFSPVTKKDTPSPSTPIDHYKEDTSDGHQLRHEERIQKDRSIDVYPETLRQRQRNMAPSPSKVDIKNWNQNEVPVRESSSPSDGKKFLPSVKALRSQFETGKSPNNGSSNGSVSPVSTFSNSSNGSGVVSGAPSKPSNRGDSATMLSRKLSGSSLASSSLEKSSSNTSLNSAPSSENLLDGELTNEPVEPIFCQFQKVDEELRELMSRPTSTSGWDPRLVLKRLYYIPEMPRAHTKGNSCVNIEGFLEKLPSGRKKATFWNAWKKRYFVAKDGVLYYYQNSQCDKPSLRLTLMGGKVETMEANMVGVDDGKGHYVVMRCSSKSEAERWRKALETHLVEDFASQYVQPQPMTTNPTLLRDTLIIDIGSCSIRAGVLASQATLPQVFFPTVLGTDRESRRQYWGPDAVSPEVRSSSSISFPIRPSHRISKYSVDLTAVSSLLSKVFSELKVDPRNYNLQISVPRVLNQHTQSELIKILFEKFGVKGVNITHQSILALYAYNATSGIVVDIGERMDIVPVTDGYIIDGGVSRVPYGGYRILDHLRQFLHMRNVSLVNDVESYIIRHVLESACYCAQHYNTEKARCSNNPENFEKSVSLKEFFSNLAQCPYESVELDFGRFQATEGLFNPDAWGLDHPGLHKLVHKAIQECSMDIRKEMSRSIFLAGGVTQLPGLADRLTAELDNLTPPAIRPKVHASPYRYHAAFIGACTLAESAAFPQSVVTKENWLKNGNAALRKWAL